MDELEAMEHSNQENIKPANEAGREGALWNSEGGILARK
jgi:hypothetical protein